MTGILHAADPKLEAIPWPEFLAKQDLVWERIPGSWEDSLFLGNGDLGATIYRRDNKLAWTINRTSLYHDKSRFPVGRLQLATQGDMGKRSARLDLWNAEASGTLVTTKGSVAWRSFCVDDPSVIVVEVKGEKGEAGCPLEWLPDEARPPRPVFRKDTLEAKDIHPDPQISSANGETTSVQPFNGGGAHAESIVELPQPDGGTIYYVAIGTGDDGKAALAEAQAATAKARELGVEKLRETNRAWWHAYYPQSFLSIPDATLQAFYWLQIYKLGAGMRPGGPVLDLNGPWFDKTPWPAIWWNLNVQLTYSPLFTANRLSLAESLFANLDRNRKNILNNVSPSLRGQAAAMNTVSGPDMVSPTDVEAALKRKAGAEMGNLPWVMYLYWLYYRYTMDPAILKDRVLPLLKAAMHYYLAFVQKGEDGLYHLPPTFSPELATVPDCNYDLALLRWGLQTLITSDEQLHINDPELAHWKEVLQNLTPPPTDETGLMIGAGRPLQEVHRHYSHLLGVYPLHLITPENPADRQLIEKSLENWIHHGEGHYTGYSFSGAASMYAVLGDGGQAETALKRCLKGWVKPNTFYKEAGPCIETPLSAAASLQDMLLQSWGGVLRVFPAVPADWPDAAFADLRGQGAFLVSAVRGGGKTQWVQVKSLAGAPCIVAVPDWKTAVVRASSGQAPRVTPTEDGRFSIELAKGDWAVLAADESTPLMPVAPVPNNGPDNPYPPSKR